MKDNFNIYHHFAGAFIPSWLLSRSEISAGAKLTYSMLAQQANSSGITQLNFRMLEGALGESEGQIARYLLELERAELVYAKRGNVNTEDVRIFFPHHPWIVGSIELSPYTPISRVADRDSQPRLFAAEIATQQTAQETQTMPDTNSASPSRQRKKKRWFGKPRSRHSFETCLSFITFQKEVLGRRRIYDPEGLAESIYFTGKQDDEIDDYLSEQKNAA